MAGPKDPTGAERQRRWKQRQKEKLERAADIIAGTPEKDRVKRLKDKLAKMQEQRDAAREDARWRDALATDSHSVSRFAQQEITRLKAQLEISKTPLPDIQEGTPEFYQIGRLEKTIGRMQGDLDTEKATCENLLADNKEMRDKWLEQGRRIRELEQENKRLKEQSGVM